MVHFIKKDKHFLIKAHFGRFNDTFFNFKKSILVILGEFLFDCIFSEKIRVETNLIVNR